MHKTVVANLTALHEAQYVYRVSEEESLARIEEFGTDRGGFCFKPSLFNPGIDHNKFIIASTLEDLQADCRPVNGVLQQKLQEIAHPIILIYDRDCLVELVKTTDYGGRDYQLKPNKTWKEALLHIVFLSQSKVKRFYFALTNFCNRSCEYCSCTSDPTKTTYLDYNKFLAILPKETPYEVQLEGGEPLLHPRFWDIVTYCKQDVWCKRIILCTNGVKLDWKHLSGWLDKFKADKPFVLKPSINAHLIVKDPRHLQKMVQLKETMLQLKWQHKPSLIFNVRYRPHPLTVDGDAQLLADLKQLGLWSYSNVFAYQRYGKAENEMELELPYVVQHPVEFYLISPDGLNFLTDLVKRANHMKNLN